MICSKSKFSLFKRNDLLLNTENFNFEQMFNAFEKILMLQRHYDLFKCTSAFSNIFFFSCMGISSSKKDLCDKRKTFHSVFLFILGYKKGSNTIISI